MRESNVKLNLQDWAIDWIIKQKKMTSVSGRVTEKTMKSLTGLENPEDTADCGADGGRQWNRNVMAQKCEKPGFCHFACMIFGTT